MKSRGIPEPTNKVLRFGGVALSAALVGAGIAALAALIAAQAMKGRSTGIGDLVAVVVSLLIGYPVGVGIGTILVKKLLRWSGSVAFGVVAAFLGAGLTMIKVDPILRTGQGQD